jgi:spermidine synthase
MANMTGLVGSFKRNTMSTFTEISESDAVTTYRLERTLWSGSTKACDSVVIAESNAYGRLLFLDGELQSSSRDEYIYHESLVHPVMASAAAEFGTPLKVLVVGGGEGATVREVLYWANVEVDWVDIDGELVDLCERYLNWALGTRQDKRVNFYAEDIGSFLTKKGNYDVIILDLPDPDGDTGYLYSSAFWTDLSAHLVIGGRIVTHVGPVSPVAAPGPFGPGYIRVRSQAAVAGLSFSPMGFYRIGIPSFQGDWGFAGAVKGPGSFFAFDPAAIQKRIPWVRVADVRQVREWGEPPLLWRTQTGETGTRKAVLP